MTAISFRRTHHLPEPSERTLRMLLTAGGPLLVGLGAVVLPLTLGLMSAMVLRTVRVSAGPVPIVWLFAIHLWDVAVLVGVAYGAVKLYRRGRPA